jgi:hypothetical protein
LHKITVYAQDIAGYTGGSETIQFTIAEEPQQPETEPFPTLEAVAVVIVTVAVSVALLIFFKKRKKSS